MLLLPPETDANRPDLFQIKAAMLKRQFSIEQGKRIRDLESVYFFASAKQLRCWHTTHGDTTTIYMIEVSYDHGKTYEDPLTRYDEV
jgi:hypothetical protein